jgi:hypothetical protein
MRELKDVTVGAADIVLFQQPAEANVLPPDSGVVGRFLDETAKMFKARAMRTNGQLRRINESGQRTEELLRTAAARMEAAEAVLEESLRKQGLLLEDESGNGLEPGDK